MSTKLTYQSPGPKRGIWITEHFFFPWRKKKSYENNILWGQTLWHTFSVLVFRRAFELVIIPCNYYVHKNKTHSTSVLQMLNSFMNSFNNYYLCVPTTCQALCKALNINWTYLGLPGRYRLYNYVIIIIYTREDRSLNEQLM